jgi:hypothetical protein
MDIPMTHLISSVQDFEIIAAYTLRVAFDDGTEQIIDFEPVLRGELYGPLRDADLFRRVHLDLEAHTLAWPNGADFDPATLHEWPNCAAAFIEMASRWETVRA